MNLRGERTVIPQAPERCPSSGLRPVFGRQVTKYFPKVEKSLLRNVSLGVFTVFLALALHAQNPRGTLRGAVQDVTGARIRAARRP